MNSSIPAALMRCDLFARAKIVASLTPEGVRLLNRHFPEWAHAGQLEPPGDWRTWVVMAGRGFGKTRAGAEWVMSCVRPSRRAFETPLQVSSFGPQDERGSYEALVDAGQTLTRRCAAPSPLQGEEGRSKVRVALVAASLDEARRVMVEGPSGILAVARAGEVKEWSFQRRRIRFASGAEAFLFSGAHPEGLRGPEHDFAWCDELAKWRYPQESWDNLQLGLRRGGTADCPGPRALVTTTPRQGEALKRLLGEEGVVQSGGGSAANPHLPDGWAERQAERLTALLARQEIGGELLQDVSGALWPRRLIEACRGWPSAVPREGEAGEEAPSLKRETKGRVLRDAAFGFAQSAHQDERSPFVRTSFVRIVVGVDPPASAMGDACGIVVCGLGVDGIGYVLADCSAGGLSPDGWARKVAGAAEAWGADRIVAEANNGGEMIASVLRAAAADLPVKLVHARRGKVARAVAVAALFESGAAKFAGRFDALEDELAGLSYDQPYQRPGRSGSRSPDRADAMVWALDALMGRGGKGPAVRGL